MQRSFIKQVCSDWTTTHYIGILHISIYTIHICIFILYCSPHSRILLSTWVGPTFCSYSSFPCLISCHFSNVSYIKIIPYRYNNTRSEYFSGGQYYTYYIVAVAISRVWGNFSTTAWLRLTILWNIYRYCIM